MENVSCDISHFYLLMERHTQYRSRTDNLKFNLCQLFDNIDLRDKTFLDIGGGAGIFSFYAAYSGVRKAVCLEPEGDGSAVGMEGGFRQLYSKSELKNVELVKDTIQGYCPTDETFDIVLLNNSINHLDEECCINLHKSTAAWKTYVEIFEKIRSLTNPGAILLICDCSRYNLFPMLGMKNPFTPAIEWHKHQSPELWARLLDCSGFTVTDITWNSFNSLGAAGKALLGNKVCAFVLGSRFTIFAKRLT